MVKIIKKVVLAVSLFIISIGTVNARNGQYTGNMTVSPITMEASYTKQANSNTCITVKLNSNTSHTYKVMFRVLNYHDELPNCSWITVTEGGSSVSAGYLSGRYEAAGDPIFVTWKNGTLLNPFSYTVNGYYIYY